MNGFVLWEGTAHGEPATAIATLISQNRKTGPMVQVWILARDVHPVELVQSGRDSETICRGCPFAAGNGCYVNVGQAPASIWRAYHRGKYPRLPLDEMREAVRGRPIRWGAYGNPSVIPLRTVKALCEVSAGWTGYFHDWHSMPEKRAREYGTYFMASTETPESLHKARELRLRTFHVSPDRPAGSLECLAVSRGIQCADCKLCAGTSKPAKSIWIAPHGSGARKAEAAAAG